jgi:hypothetical protein
MNRAPPTSRPSSSSFPSPPFGGEGQGEGPLCKTGDGFMAPAPSPGPKAGRPLPAGARRGTSKKIATPLVTAILLFLLCLTPHLAHALSVVQTVSCTDQSTCTITGVAAGDMLLFGADLEQTPATLSFSDSAGDTWADDSPTANYGQQGVSDNNDGTPAYIFRDKSATAGSHTLTVSIGAPGHLYGFGAWVIEVTGAAGTLDKEACDANAGSSPCSSQASDTSPSTGTTGTLSESKEIAVAVCAFYADSIASGPTHGTGLAEVTGSTYSSVAVAYQIVSSTSALSNGWTLSGPVSEGCLIATYPAPGNAAVGGPCTYGLEPDGTVGQQVGYDNALYTCLSASNTWTPEGFIVGNTLASGSSATTSCTTAYHGMLEYTSGAFEYCTGSTWTAFSSYTPVSGTVGNGTGVLVELTTGTAAAPSLTFHADTTTGLYQPATHTLGITTAGAERVAFDASGDFNLVGATAQYQLDSIQILTTPAADTVYSLAVGDWALYYDEHVSGTTGEYNLAVGYDALPGTSATPMTGADNALAGAAAGEYVDSTPSFSTAVGYGALGGCCGYAANYPGNDNTAIGSEAMYEYISSSGGTTSDNTLAGEGACNNPAYGVTNSVLIGANAGSNCANSAAVTAAVVIGATSLVNSGAAITDDIVFGMENIGANITGTDVIDIAAGMTNTTGGQNIAINTYALNNLTTGSSNIAIGGDAAGYETTGTDTAIGNDALGQQQGSADTNAALGGATNGGGASIVTTGGYNLAIGFDALTYNTTGSNNTAIGNGSMQSCWDAYGCGSVGNNNTGLGPNTLNSLQGVSATPVTASENTAAGAWTGVYITSGYYNTAIGYVAMAGVSNTPLTGASNVAVGGWALPSLQGTADNNTAFGASAGYNLTTGTDNTLIGYEAGYSVTGNSNIVLGEDTSGTLTTGNSNIWIGNNLTLITGSSNYQLDIGDLITGQTTSATSPNVSLQAAFADSESACAYTLTETTGFNATIQPKCGTLIIGPAGTLASGTLQLPASPVNGQIERIASTQTITAFTLQPYSGTSVKNAITTIGPTLPATYMYDSGTTTWYRIQ